MFNREITSELKVWKIKANRKPLILRGARQVGKTTLIKQFSENFNQFIYLNLELEEDRRIFQNAASFNELIEAIYFIKNASISEKNTLIFIDEIQNSPAAVKYLRYFYENKPELYIIAAGSLLESLINKEISFPVGRVEYLALRPFSFTEFLEAGNFNAELEAIKTIPVPAFAHERLMSLFKKYTIIGGMPEIIKLLMETNDITEIKKTVNNLLIAYKEDVEKYARNENQSRIIRFIIDNAFRFASERITFNHFGASNYKSREVSEAFRILEKTMLLSLVYPTISTKLPLSRNLKMSPKLQLLDTGMVNLISGIEKEILLEKDLTDTYRGKIAEHIVGQELLAKEYSPEASLIFWVREKKQSDAEIDFIKNYNGKIIPIEVKSGSSGKMRSLKIFMNSAKGDLAVRFYSGKFEITEESLSDGKKFKLLNMPLYLTSVLNDYLYHYCK
ncbi:MAG: AAA family ATPase [Ignavibacterium sp.]|nr:AAA family ATPase [Ignavibacterium sp.]